MRDIEALLSQVKVTLRKDGNIAIVYSNVPISDVVKTFDESFPDYPHTTAIKNYMLDLEVLTKDYLDRIDSIKVSD
jgi:hypothetical protein